MNAQGFSIMADKMYQQRLNGVILKLLNITKQFPRTHLVALSSCATVLVLTLVFVPSQDVAAERSDNDTREVITLAALDSTPALAPAAPKANAAAEQSVPVPLAIEVIDSSLPLITESDSAGSLALAEQQPAATTAAAIPEEHWLRIKVRSGDNLTTLFKKAGLGANEMYPLLNGIKPKKSLHRLMPGEELEFLVIDGELQKIRHTQSPLLSTLITKTDAGYQVDDIERTPEVQQIYKRGTIEQSLFLAGQAAGLSQTKIMELASIFGWDVDFALDIRKGDSFSLIYEELLLDGKVIQDGNIVAAEFTNQGKTFRAIRYTDSKGDSNYYTPDGKSMRKAFLRTPVDFARISSRFNPNRKHPIFKTTRPHKGVDYAAPRGTPIKSSGEGKVVFAGRKGGYGKVVIVQHGQRYTTLYAHMSRIKPGMKRGKRVKQGQTIGYVGSTGYATGPHLHYEFRVNGVHRNPLTVPLPQAQPLPNRERANFTPLATDMLALLETYAQTRLASAE